MNNLFNLSQPNQIKQLYNSLGSLHKNKEKIHMTLEPLQSMIQFSPTTIKDGLCKMFKKNKI